jgi:glycosyltransferase involved in cell wall biosynthesis
MRKLSIIIPIYNEAATFEKLLKRVLAVKIPLKKEIIIVEGGSTDGTTKLVKKYKGKPGIKIFFVTEHIGKGYKVRYGIKRATGDIIMIQDADLEYDPADYNDLLAPILKGKTKFVLGSRHLRKHTWKIREFARGKWYKPAILLNVGDHMLKLYFTTLYGTYLTDPNTMYKVFSRDCLKGITLRSNNFDLDMELLIKLFKKGYRPIEVPVSYHGRSYEEGKKIHPVRDGLRAGWAILRYRFSN